MDLDFVSVHKLAKKELGQYPAILTSHLVNNPYKQTHALVLCKANLLQEKNKNVIYRARSVRMGKNCALGLEYGPRPTASGRTQDLGHSFFPYGPPAR